MPRSAALLALLCLAVLLPGAASSSAQEQPAAQAVPAGAAPVASSPEKQSFEPGEVIVSVGDGEPQLLDLAPEADVPRTAAALDRLPGISASPNYHVRATWVPNDPGRAKKAGASRTDQWNFKKVRAEEAWDILRAAGVPGAKGITVAVLDGGIAYRNGKVKHLKRENRRWRQCRKSGKSPKKCLKRCRKRAGKKTSKRKCRWDFNRKMRAAKLSPDFKAGQFVAPRSFVGGKPDDRDGHGTHVAGTIAGATNNGRYLTGLAYNAKLMPVKVLDRHGSGTALDLARGLRWAADHGADVINLSLAFSPGVYAEQVPVVEEALRYAYEEGAVIVGAAGNDAVEGINYPARSQYVISVGASRRDGELANYSNWSSSLDIVAPGGGGKPSISQVGVIPLDPILPAFKFGIVGASGTSMATPHVAAAVAMIQAKAQAETGNTLGSEQVRQRLRQSASCRLSYLGIDLSELYGRCWDLNLAGALGG